MEGHPELGSRWSYTAHPSPLLSIPQSCIFVFLLSVFRRKNSKTDIHSWRTQSSSCILPDEDRPMLCAVARFSSLQMV